MAILNSSMEKHLWDIVYGLWVNAKLKPSESAILFLGLVFLKYTEFRCNQAAKKTGKANALSRQEPGKTDYQRLGVLYVPEEARFSFPSICGREKISSIVYERNLPQKR